MVCYSPYHIFEQHSNLHCSQCANLFLLKILLQLDCLTLHDVVHCDSNRPAEACFCDCGIKQPMHYHNSSHSLSAKWLDAAEVSCLITGEVSCVVLQDLLKPGAAAEFPPASAD